MAQWTYSDWITLDDNSARLVRLRLHIQEVSEYVLRTQAEGFESELNREYLPLLLEKEQQLQSLGETSTRFGGRNRARFSNV